MRAELAAAFMLLTRLPVGWMAGGRVPAGFADAIWAFPLVGAVVGAIGGVVLWGAAALHVPPVGGVVLALAAMLLATGAMHEDGLADTADGFGGGRTRERKLEIMRDSRIGSFGALALMLTLAARGAGLLAATHPVAALVATSALGRGAILVVMLALPPARSDGLGAGLRGRSLGRAAIGLGIAAAFAVVLLGGPGAKAWVVALVVAALMAWAARRQIGGYTGDVLGATSVLAEAAVLLTAG